ncbi:unknown [Corallococcus sp. CAG:1435]|nr:unknown [Corallococcus sp. CAG:1435]
MSNASPLADLNVEGTNKHPSLIKGVEEKSHDVTPLASKVCRIPPVGKLEASPSPCNSSFMRNFAKAFPLPSTENRLSLLPAERLLRG